MPSGSVLTSYGPVADIQARLDVIEAEASALWSWAHEGAAERGLDAPDVELDNHFEQDRRSS